MKPNCVADIFAEAASHAEPIPVGEDAMRAEIVQLRNENTRLRAKLSRVQSDASWAAHARSEERRHEWEVNRRGDEFS